MITQPITFDPSEELIISQELAKLSFNHESWGDSVFEDLRTKIKQYYIKQQNYTCPYCQQELNTTNGRVWDIEHIIARESAQNFMFIPENLCISCIDCNSKKSNKKITTSNAKVHFPSRLSQYIIVHPHFDEYDENIIVVEPGFYYIALEEKGEKTIEICGLNRFWKFAGYNSSVSHDNMIQILAKGLSDARDEKTKKDILKKITFLTIQQLSQKKFELPFQTLDYKQKLVKVLLVLGGVLIIIGLIYIIVLSKTFQG